MLLSLLYSFFSKPAAIAKQRLTKKFSSLSIVVSDPEIKLYKQFTKSDINVSLTKAKIVQKYTYMRVEID